MSKFVPHQEIILIPKSQKGKARIERWGRVWTICVVRSDSLLVVADCDFSGDANNAPDSIRNVLLCDDPHFEIKI